MSDSLSFSCCTEKLTMTTSTLAMTTSTLTMTTCTLTMTTNTLTMTTSTSLLKNVLPKCQLSHCVAVLSKWFLWCSGYHVCLTRTRSPVRSRAETRFFFPYSTEHFHYLNLLVQVQFKPSDRLLHIFTHRTRSSSKGSRIWIHHLYSK